MFFWIPPDLRDLGSGRFAAEAWEKSVLIAHASEFSHGQDPKETWADVGIAELQNGGAATKASG